MELRSASLFTAGSMFLVKWWKHFAL